MACNTCNTKFNFFHKEMGCANCGMSFCNKCLKQKCKLPSKGTGEFNVCRICFNKLTSTEPDSSNFAPPDSFLNESSTFRSLLRRLENLENPSTPPITIYKHNQKFQKMKIGLTPADQKLVERLEKLKDEKKKSPPPSENELRKRLANLKGENYVESSGKNLFPQDFRSDQEKTDDLLRKFVSEREIELQHNPQEEIEARLATLREKGVRPNEGTYVSNLHDSDDDSEEEIKRITRKVMNEVTLESKTGNIFGKNDEEPTETNEDNENLLPWCVLCNDDAVYRCLDCGGDLYCAKCHKEVHKDWHDDHKIVPFKRK